MLGAGQAVVDPLGLTGHRHQGIGERQGLRRYSTVEDTRDIAERAIGVWSRPNRTPSLTDDVRHLSRQAGEKHFNLVGLAKLVRDGLCRERIAHRAACRRVTTLTAP